MTTLIVGALEEEIDGIRALLQEAKPVSVGAFTLHCGKMAGHTVYLCRCGVGKVNAAAAVSAVLAARSDIVRVINMGVAGGIGNGVKRGDVVLGEKTVYHDFDSTPDGMRKGQVQGFDSEFFYSDKVMLAVMEEALTIEGVAYHVGTIATGDRFIADKAVAAGIRDEFGADACEMESAAIAHVCALYAVPFLAVRAVSDNGDDGAVESFYTFLTRAVQTSTRTVERFMQLTQE